MARIADPMKAALRARYTRIRKLRADLAREEGLKDVVARAARASARKKLKSKIASEEKSYLAEVNRLKGRRGGAYKQPAKKPTTTPKKSDDLTIIQDKERQRRKRGVGRAGYRKP